MITTLYEDTSIAVIHKPAGIASQATQVGGDSIMDALPASWQPVHRLDQRVSGIMLIAKNTASLTQLNADFASRKVVKKYRAIVANKPAKSADTLIHWLLKDGKQHKVKAFTKAVAHSQQAELAYQLIQSSLKYHLLDITLFTGRFHQIRTQLATINCPIVGDVKYGYKRTTPDGSIFLQSYQLTFTHPITKTPMHFEIEMPELWHKYGL